MIRRLRKALALWLADWKSDPEARKKARRAAGQRYRKPRRPKKRDAYEPPRGLSDE